MKYIITKFADDEFGSAILDWAVFSAGLAAMSVVLIAAIVTV